MTVPITTDRSGRFASVDSFRDEKKFGILLHDAKPEKIKNGSWRLYDDARAEIFAGHNETTEEEYKKRVEEACAF